MQMTAITWNTQGSPLNNQNKRDALVALCQTYDFILLQECGDLVDQQSFATKVVYGAAQAGAFNRRCSTAIICSQADASGTWNGGRTGRPGIWVRKKNLYVGTIHCISGGTGMEDLRPFLLAMAEEAGESPFIIGGDFNCIFDQGAEEIQLGTKSRPNVFNLHTQLTATHKAGMVLDHFVSRNIEDVGVPRRYRQHQSDHDAVTITFKPPEQADNFDPNYMGE